MKLILSAQFLSLAEYSQSEEKPFQKLVQDSIVLGLIEAEWRIYASAN